MAIQESNDAVCRTCGKHLQRSTGSITQWVFRQEICSCAIEKDKESETSPIEEQQQENDLFAGSFEPGRIIARHYRIISCLGEGGTSVVYKSQHEIMDRIAAVKVLSPDRIPDAKTIQRFQQEARSVSRLKHPNIVDIHEFGIDENKQPYLVMDYLEGKSLFDLVQNEGPLKPARAAALFLQMADALLHAHEKGVIHRDLKPTNAILTKDESGRDAVKLVDFGIAKLNEPEDKEKALTQTGEIFGSPFYMSPEQCRGHRLDHRSDIYSFGCLMFEMIVGEPAAKSDSVVETLMIHVNGLTPDFENQPVVKTYAELAAQDDSFENRHEQKCLNGLRQVIQSCVKKDPADRYQSMADVKRDLERLLGGTQIFGAKESALPWASIKLPGNGSGRAKSTFSEVLPVAVVIIAFAGILGTLFLKSNNIVASRDANAVSKPLTAAPEPTDTTFKIAARLTGDKYCPIEELSEATLPDLKNAGVTTIKMRNVQISDRAITLLSRLTSLETIDLTGSSGFSQNSIEQLSKLPKLKTLILGGTDVSDKLSLALTHMPLQRLDLAYTRFTERGIERLTQMKTLRHIKVLKILNEKEARETLAKHGWKPGLSDWFER